MPPGSRFCAVRNGLQDSVRLIPRAKCNAVEGVIERADGARTLKVRVTAAPEKGNANAALLDLLARCWDMPKSRLSIVAGESSRNKIVFIRGDPDTLLAHLAAKGEEN